MKNSSKEMMDFLFRNESKITIEYDSFRKNHDPIPYRRAVKKYRGYDKFPFGFYYRYQTPQERVIGANAEFFYQTFTRQKIDPKESYLGFTIDRDDNLEEAKYKEITSLIGDKYIIINEDPGRSLCIDRKYLPINLPTFNINGSSRIVFDIIRLIENAKEIHLISTFWSLIVYNLQKKYNLFAGIPIYYHSYVRDGYYDFLYLDSDWKFIGSTTN